MSDIWPSSITEEDKGALDELASADVGEGDLDDDHSVPPDLIELSEVLEWEAAVKAAEEEGGSDA